MHCFFCRNIPPTGQSAILDERDRKHLFRTLRAQNGETVQLRDGNGVIATATVGDSQTLTVKDIQNFPMPEQRLCLFVAPPRKQQMDAMLKQCAEIGVDEIIPIITRFSVSTPEKDSVLEHWLTTLEEACKQAKNPFTPRISMPLDFRAALSLASDRKLRCFYGSPREGVSPLELSGELTDIAWFVGPEGGFSAEEEQEMADNGFTALRLTPWILRVETAAVTGSMILKLKASAK